MVSIITLGDEIRNRRLLKGLTQEQLSEVSKIAPSYLSKIENNRLGKGEGPGREVIKRLAENLIHQGEKFEEVYERFMLLADKLPENIESEILAHLKTANADFRRSKKNIDSLFERIRQQLKKK